MRETGSIADRPGADDAPAAGERIAKRIARAGLCSRREAERMIAAGRVTLGGRTLRDPATRVNERSAVAVDGVPLPGAAPARLWRYHKPPGLIVSHGDPQGRRTVFEAVSERLGRVVSVGRLDLNSEGLLLLTNDGGLARALEHPSCGWRRRYRVRVHGTVREEALARLADGVAVGGVRYGPIDARLDRVTGRNAWLTVSLTEGRNREVRIVLDSLGLRVARLIRTAYGPFQIGALARGESAQVPPKVLREQMGKGWERAGADRRR